MLQLSVTFFNIYIIIVFLFIHSRYYVIEALLLSIHQQGKRKLFIASGGLQVSFFIIIIPDVILRGEKKGEMHRVLG